MMVYDMIIKLLVENKMEATSIIIIIIIEQQRGIIPLNNI